MTDICLLASCAHVTFGGGGLKWAQARRHTAGTGDFCSSLVMRNPIFWRWHQLCTVVKYYMELQSAWCTSASDVRPYCCPLTSL
jgi:hypothetical protein